VERFVNGNDARTEDEADRFAASPARLPPEASDRLGDCLVHRRFDVYGRRCGAA